MSYDNKIPDEEQKQRTYENAAEARRNTLVDGSGNTISSHITTDGDYHLGTSVEQNVVADANNSSTTNLDPTEVFTGTSTSTLGVVGLQWSLKTTQNCEVCVEQSDDETNWDLSDCWDYRYALGGAGGTVQALKSYWRIKVTNQGPIATTSLRLSGVLCPIVESVPRILSNQGNLQVVASLRGDENYDRHAWINPTSELNTSPVPRLVGTAFNGLVIDERFWTPVVTNSATITQGGGININDLKIMQGSPSEKTNRKFKSVVKATSFN